MTFFEILDTIILKPLVLLFEAVYMMSEKVVDNPGISIIMLSLFVNFLALPLYIRADAIQEKEHAIEKKLKKGVDHIKKTFHGDERMMMLQTYYRQNNYKPVYVLRSAISLFLQIPFFIAAYRFLSGLQLISGVPFGPIADMGNPDGMLQIGAMNINILPIIMTVVNVISCVIFTKGSPLKSKIQLYGMALFFLVFLYDSPSGLVFYWTLNNIFSLIKTILYKLKNPKKVIGMLSAAAGGICIIYSIFFYQYEYNIILRKALLAGFGILLQIPLFFYIMKKRIHKKEIHITGNWKVFFSGALFLALLAGLVIPSAVIKMSPQEFLDITYFYHPLWFTVSSFCMALGMFVLWAGVFYFLAKPHIRGYFDRGVWIFSIIAVVNYMFFGKNLGNLNAHLKFDNEIQYTRKEIFGNAAIVIILVLALYILYRKYEKWITEILLTAVFALSVMTVVNIMSIHNSINNVDSLYAEGDREIPEITLSKNGKNVIVLMLDRGMGEYIPYIFNEKPELEEKFSGFTYYTNMVSFGGSTNFSVPSLFGGYEYTPIEINKRTSETLREKHDEALKVMPVLFTQNDYQVTVCDPPYAGYQWIPDLSIYDDYPEIKSYITEGRFKDSSMTEQEFQNNKRNFFCYSMFKVLPVCFQKFVYDQGKYNQSEFEITYSEQIQDSHYTATGLYNLFMYSYNVLTSLPEITKPIDEEKNTFLMMENGTTHYPALLQEPDYVPAVRVNNIEYGKDYQKRFIIDGKRLKVETDIQLIHYQSNMAALLILGEWFDYLREENVYDNTRIILVSDHGIRLSQIDDLITDDGFDISGNYALLMVKDFGSSGFHTSEEFMTCADVPMLAMEDIIEEPINPFTGKKIGYGDKTVHKQYIIDSWENNITNNNDTQFSPARWYTVQDDMRNPENWKLVAEDVILPVE